MPKIQLQNKPPYKNPVLLFTSSSMRIAAYAGWHSALGDTEKAQGFVHQAYAEWVKEVGAGRKYVFLDRFSDDIYKRIDFDKLKRLTDKYLLDIKTEIRLKEKDELAKGF